MAIEEKAANSRQSVDLKWKLHKALEEQVSEASDGSGIEFGKDVTVDGKLHMNDFSDIQNAKGEALGINYFTLQIEERSGHDFACLLNANVFSLKDSLSFDDVFKDGRPVAVSGEIVIKGSSGEANRVIRPSRAIYYDSYDRVVFYFMSADNMLKESWHSQRSNFAFRFYGKIPLARPKPGQRNEEE